MKNKLFPIRKNQRGFTLVELLIALAITVVIGSVIMMTVTQLYSVSISSDNHMNAVKQVENALHYMNRDAQQASINRSPSLASPGTDFPLNLQWIDYTDNTTHQVSYRLDGTDLMRDQTIDSNSPTSMRVASHISADSYYSFDGEVLSINLISSVEGYKPAEEQRVLEVKPRVN